MGILQRIVCIFGIFMVGLAAEEQEIVSVPKGDFLRDVMMPIGLPVVSTYHAVRENVFLNTRKLDETVLESVANILLAPSQYLFAGKTLITKGADDYEVVQSYHYDHLYWLKTITSLIVLPVSEVLGSACKALAYLSPEVRNEHEKIQRALKSTIVRSHLDEYERKGLPSLFCEESIPCQGHKRPSQLTKNQRVEIQAFKEIVELLEANNIVYWIDCGTCLGAYRYGGIIPWDWDIDLSIFMYDHDNVKKLLSTLDPEKYQIQDWSSYDKPKTFLKLFIKETNNFIDIYHYDINEKDQTVGYVFTYIDSPFPDSWKKVELTCVERLKYEDIFPLKWAKFDHLKVRAPHNVVTFLQSKYGENLDPAKVWDEEAKTYRKVPNHPYYQRTEGN